MEFTERQLEAISHADGNLQLVACAGSGKTEVVARRVARLLQGGAAPADIIAFTFTEKAAGELQERIHRRCTELLGEVTGLAEMFVGTIHAFCLDLLKTEIPEFMKYEVLNEVRQVLFVDRNSRASGLTLSTTLDDKRLKRFVDTRNYIGALSILREANVNPQVFDACTVAGHLATYEELLRRHRYFDYSSILIEAVGVLLTDESLRTRLAERVRHVIVDEYQDVNPVQETIVRALHDLGASVCVVGDDDQTIYQWRGSDVTNILSFADRYPSTEVRLQENFRSSEGVVDTARRFIRRNNERLDKEMIPTGAHPYESGDIVALSFDSLEDEAAYVARTCSSLLGVAIRDGDGERGMAWSDMAVLMRSVRKTGRAFTEAFDAARVPYIVVGMNTLFDTAEVQAARALFYYLAARDDVSEVDVFEAWVGARAGIDPIALRAALGEVSATRAAIHTSDEQRFSFYNLQRVFLDFLEAAGVREDLVPDGRGEVLFYNLGKFSQLISDFEAIHWKSRPSEKYKTFEGFLEYHAENSYAEGAQDVAYANPNAVRIMTIHQSKGMQWPAVFVPNLLKNLFPSKGHGGRTVWHLLPAEHVRGAGRYRGTVEDERRLFYVAMTRAEKFLHLSWGPIGSNRLFQKASDFWRAVLESRFVQRRYEADYSGRRRLPPRPKAGVSNVALTFSDIKYFFECPYQFKLRILYGFNAPIHEALGYGKSLHDALAEVHARAIRGDIALPEEAEQLVQTHLHTPYAYPTLRETLQASARRVITDYLVDNSDTFAQLEFSEKAIRINLADGVSVVGRVDLVRRLDTDEVSIIDLKSNDRAQAENLTETQLHIYALGYRELTGRDADYVTIYNLDERRQDSRTVQDSILASVEADVLRTAEALRTGEMAPDPTPKKCAGCDYRRMCSAGACAD